MELDIRRSRYRPRNSGSSTTETALKSSTSGSHSVLVPALAVDALPSQGSFSVPYLHFSPSKSTFSILFPVEKW